MALMVTEPGLHAPARGVSEVYCYTMKATHRVILEREVVHVNFSGTGMACCVIRHHSEALS